MKRQIYIFSLCVIILLTSFNVLGYAATNSEIKLLEDLGIIKPISHTGLIKSGYNRGEFAASLSVMSSVEPLKHNVNDEDLKKYAEDIAGNENVNGIIEAIAGGYMENDEKNNFKPGSTLSKEDAIKALVRILGYKSLAETYGGTTQAYYQAASVIGLLKKCSFADENSLTQEETAKLLVNAMSIRFFSDGTRYLDKECFYDYWKIEKHTGRVLANSRIGLVVERTSPGMVNIDEKLYETEMLFPDETVGSYVTFYTRKEENGLKIVSYTISKSSDTVTLSAKDIEKVEFKNNLFRIEHKKGELRLNANGYAIVNGNTQTPTEELFYAFKNGSATFVDSDNNGVYDVVHMTLLKQVVVDSVAPEFGILTTKFENECIDISDIEISEIYLNKKLDSIDKIKSGMIVGVACDSYSLSSSGEITYDYKKAENITLYASSSSFYGQVVKINSETVWINDTYYELGSGYNELLNKGFIHQIKPGDIVTVYLDTYNDIGYYVPDLNNPMQYGYLIKSKVVNKNLDSGLFFKILDTSGEIKVYKTDDTMLLDGQKVDCDTTLYNVDGDAVDLTKRQPIRFRIINDTVREVDTATVRSLTENKETSLNMDLVFDPYISGQSTYRVGFGVVNRQYVFGKDCVVFWDEADINDPDPSETNFSVTDGTSFAGDVYMGGFDSTEENEIACAVVYSNYGTSDGNTRDSLAAHIGIAHIVEDVMEAINQNGEFGWLLKMSAPDTVSSEIFVKDDSLRLYTAPTANESGWSNEYIRLSREDASQISQIVKKGDVIRFTKNAMGEITYIEKIFDYTTHKNSLVPPPMTGGQIFGFVNVERISGDYIICSYDNSGKTYTFKRRAGQTSLPVYWVKNDMVTLETFDTIPSAAKGKTVKAYVHFYNYSDLKNIMFYVYD